MRLGIIGYGAIDTDFLVYVDTMNEIEKIYLFNIDKKAENKLVKKIRKAKCKFVKDFLDEVDVVFEAASQKAVNENAEIVFDAYKDRILRSIGSLFDDKFRGKLEDITKKKHYKIFVPSGVVCGIDSILSASIDKINEVTLVTTKSPKYLGKGFDRRTIVFLGSASDALKDFPQNINVAASLSLAGVGFYKTRVEIVADPVATRNSHKILAHGGFVRLRAEIENMPNPNNLKSSYMSSLSAIATFKRITNPIQMRV